MNCLTVVILSTLFCGSYAINQTKLDEARVYLGYLDEKVCQGRYAQANASFNYYINATSENLKKLEEQEQKSSLYDAEYTYFDWKSFNDSYLLRLAKSYGLLEPKVDPNLLKAYGEVKAEILDIANQDYTVCYNTSSNGTLCGYKLFVYMTNSVDEKERIWYWKATHDTLCRNMRPAYERYINLSNAYAVACGYKSQADKWISDFEMPNNENFECTMKDLWEQVKPLYLQYFSYFRNQLRQHFGEDKISKRGPIPLQYFDFFHALSLSSPLVKPYPEKGDLDITAQLVKQNYTVMRIARLAEDFYKSLGMGPLPDDLWQHSMFVKPEKRPVVCGATSWDLCDKKTFRVSFCGDVDGYTFQTMLHEFGHVYEFIGYKDQPCGFRNPASLGLDEGLADTMVMPTRSINFLKRLKLISPSDIDKEVLTNTMFKIAGDTLAYLPMTLLTDLWRWDMFWKNITPDRYNKAFWEYRLQYQGTVPPEERSEEYLDATDDPLLSDGTQTIIYFIQFLFEFQNFEALCIAAGQFDPKNPKANPLNNCDLYGSKLAGNMMKDMYKYGSSVPWTEVMKAGTGKNYLDAGPLLRYFQTLYDWLVEENKKSGEFIGWEV